MCQGKGRVLGEVEGVWIVINVTLLLQIYSRCLFWGTMSCLFVEVGQIGWVGEMLCMQASNYTAATETTEAIAAVPC